MQADDIRIVVDTEFADDPVYLVTVATPRGSLQFMGAFELDRRTITVRASDGKPGAELFEQGESIHDEEPGGRSSVTVDPVRRGGRPACSNPKGRLRQVASGFPSDALGVSTSEATRNSKGAGRVSDPSAGFFWRRWMSTTSSFMERFAPRARIPGGAPTSSGSPVRLRLTFEPGANLPEAARILARSRLPLTKAHAALTTLVDIGKVFVTVPVVDDVERLKRDLAAAGVLAHLHSPSHVDVSALRRGTNLSVEDFSVRFGLDAEEVEGWEHARSEPDLAARTLLWTIARHPEAVEASIDMDGPEPELR